MGLTLTDAAYSALSQAAKEPNLVLRIEGVDTVYGAAIIKKYARFGDDDLEFGDPAADVDATYFGGLNRVGDQDNLITLEGTSTSIKQTLNVDKGQGGSISTLSIALMDNGDITRLITPGEIVDDILMRQCIVYMGFNGTAWPDDYVVIFRGLITDVTADPGKVVLQLNHADDKKRTNIFKSVETSLYGAIGTTTVSIPVDSVDNFLVKIRGPDGTYDATFGSYVKIDDEIIQYENVFDAATSPFTVTIASPGVFTLAAHNFPNDLPVRLTTTGALPTGLLVATTYYAINTTTNTFQLAPTPGGTPINTSGTQSGIHSVIAPAFLGTVTRARLGSVAAAHDDNSSTKTFYRLQGNAVDLALKIMSSGNISEGVSIPFTSIAGGLDIPVTSVVVGGLESVPNAIFFKDMNVADELGLVAGDWLHELSGSQYTENNVRNKQIIEVIRGDQGDFVVIDGVTFTPDTTVLPDVEIAASFTSQFATLPDGCVMRPDEIDIDEHLRWQRLFLSSVEYDFYLDDGIETARDFIEQQIYLPMAAYSLPRKARASMGYHVGPLPGQNIVTFDETNLKNPASIMLKRSTNNNFWNEIVYKYDKSAVDGEYKAGFLTISQNSKNRIKNAPNRTLTIEADGMRTVLSADNIAQSQSARRISRYQYGAEVLTIQALMDKSFSVEIGDIVIFDGTRLNIPDIKTGLKGMTPRFFEVLNKDFQLKTGDVKLDIIDTNSEGSARYGLISPASTIKAGISTTSFIIGESFASRFGSAEYRKWLSYRKCSVRIRNADFSTTGDTVIQSATSNTITVSPALAFVPSAGMIMELSVYVDTDTTDQIKLIYGFLRDTDFPDGEPQYQML